MKLSFPKIKVIIDIPLPKPQNVFKKGAEKVIAAAKDAIKKGIAQPVKKIIQKVTDIPVTIVAETNAIANRLILFNALIALITVVAIAVIIYLISRRNNKKQ